MGTKKRGDVDLVVVVHLDRAVEPRHGRPRGRLGLADDQRDAVDEQNQVEPPHLRAGRKHELGDDQAAVIPARLEIHQPDGSMLAVGAERHRALPAQPGGELLVGAHQAVGVDREQDGAQPVEHLVGAVGPGRDLRVEADQRVPQMRLDQHVARGARQLRSRQEAPAEAFRPRRGLLRAIGSAWLADARAGRRLRAAQQVTDEVLDAVLFVEHEQTLFSGFAMMDPSPHCRY